MRCKDCGKTGVDLLRLAQNCICKDSSGHWQRVKDSEDDMPDGMYIELHKQGMLDSQNDSRAAPQEGEG